MNRLLQLGWAVRRRLVSVLRLRTRGVKVLLVNANGEVLLIRNGYGDTRSWVLPGGGIRWREEPHVAAARELREEVGITAATLRWRGDYHSTSEGKRDSVSLFEGRSDQIPRIDRREVSEARFHRADALPPAVSPATRRRIGEWQAGGPFGGAW